MMEKSIEQITQIVHSKISMILISELPVPSCPLKKQQREWKVEQIKKALSNKLSPQGLSITVSL
jgi:hypothetical protein